MSSASHHNLPQIEHEEIRAGMPSLLTARHVAELCDVSPDTVLRWTRDGKVPALRLPSGQIRYRREQIDAWLNDRATAPVSMKQVMLDTAARIAAERRN